MQLHGGTLVSISSHRSGWFSCTDRDICRISICVGIRWAGISACVARIYMPRRTADRHRYLRRFYKCRLSGCNYGSRSRANCPAVLPGTTLRRLQNHESTSVQRKFPTNYARSAPDVPFLLLLVWEARPMAIHDLFCCEKSTVFDEVLRNCLQRHSLKLASPARYNSAQTTVSPRPQLV